jgi:hypothetical protein
MEKEVRRLKKINLALAVAEGESDRHEPSDCKHRSNGDGPANGSCNAGRQADAGGGRIARRSSKTTEPGKSE